MDFSSLVAQLAHHASFYGRIPLECCESSLLAHAVHLKNDAILAALAEQPKDKTRKSNELATHKTSAELLPDSTPSAFSALPKDPSLPRPVRTKSSPNTPKSNAAALWPPHSSRLEDRAPANPVIDVPSLPIPPQPSEIPVVAAEMRQPEETRVEESTTEPALSKPIRVSSKLAIRNLIDTVESDDDDDDLMEQDDLGHSAVPLPSVPSPIPAPQIADDKDEYDRTAHDESNFPLSQKHRLPSPQQMPVNNNDDGTTDDDAANEDAFPVSQKRRKLEPKSESQNSTPATALQQLQDSASSPHQQAHPSLSIKLPASTDAPTANNLTPRNLPTPSPPPSPSPRAAKSAFLHHTRRKSFLPSSSPPTTVRSQPMPTTAAAAASRGSVSKSTPSSSPAAHQRHASVPLLESELGGTPSSVSSVKKRKSFMRAYDSIPFDAIFEDDDDDEDDDEGRDNESGSKSPTGSDRQDEEAAAPLDRPVLLRNDEDSDASLDRMEGLTAGVHVEMDDLYYEVGSRNEVCAAASAHREDLAESRDEQVEEERDGDFEGERIEGAAPVRREGLPESLGEQVEGEREPEWHESRDHFREDTAVATETDEKSAPLENHSSSLEVSQKHGVELSTSQSMHLFSDSDMDGSIGDDLKAIADFIEDDVDLFK
ncbi:hypothetical protein HDU98_003378 [Podochytrium sp. JEL0797]|nr:hypothetical protein HDU98_003378 [Podochytrium sp. JEL0797]